MIIIDPESYFDRVVVVNLAHRTERMEQFRQAFKAWPFRTPERFEAVDGMNQILPVDWTRGAGAYGCTLSHQQIMQKAIDDKISKLFVLEDDACLVENFSAKAQEFLCRVPKDWDAIMFGGEHMRHPIPVGKNAVRCTATNRTHAFAIRGKMMQALLDFWRHVQNEHCDIVLASLMPYFAVYAPDPFLIGQETGTSDITGKDEVRRFLSADELNAIAKPAP